MTRIVFLVAVFILGCTGFAMADQHGNASYYSSKLKGRHTSDGGRYHPDSLTCAHRTLPFGTLLMVRNPKNDERIVVKVTDRGPFSKHLMIDLSFSAAKALDIIRSGIAPVEIYKLDFWPEGLLSLPTPQTFISVGHMFLASQAFFKQIEK